MTILIISPDAPVAHSGNRHTAGQWAQMLDGLGHRVRLDSDYDGEPADVVIALHGRKSHEALAAAREALPTATVVLVLTGTDLYPAPDATVEASMAMADRIVALQDKALEQVPPAWRERVTVIVQSAERLVERAEPDPGRFDVCVVGHMREVKDPLLAPRAARLLPGDSRIRVRHAGGVLEPDYEPLARREVSENPRYEWLGELGPRDTAALIAASRLLVVTSRSEGGARVVGEALVHGTPVLSTRIDGVVGLLGEDYPGYFPVGDDRALADLLRRCETDPSFLRELDRSAAQQAPRFAPEREVRALHELLLDATANHLPSIDS